MNKLAKNTLLLTGFRTCISTAILTGIFSSATGVASASGGETEEFVTLPVCFTAIFAIILIALAVALFFLIKSLLFSPSSQHRHHGEETLEEVENGKGDNKK